jgi:hypothetical protein
MPIHLAQSRKKEQRLLLLVHIFPVFSSLYSFSATLEICLMVSFEVFCDSNVAKSWKAVAADQDRLKGSILRQTTTTASLSDNLKTVSQTTKFLLVSALTNPITRLKFEGTALLGLAVTDLLDELFDFLVQTTNNNPELKVSLISYFLFQGKPLARA